MQRLKEGTQGKVVKVRKRRLDEVVRDEGGEEDIKAKWARFASSGLLDFEGLVSGDSKKSRHLLTVFFFFTVRSLCLIQGEARVCGQGGGREMHKVCK
jgi:hypothetical protein